MAVCSTLLPDDKLRLDWQGVTGRRYRLLGSDDPQYWCPVGTLVDGVTGALLVTSTTELRRLQAITVPLPTDKLRSRESVERL